MSDYNFVYLDEDIKCMICCVILKGIVVLGYQVFFVSCEMLMFYGWGMGGVQVMVVMLVFEDVLKVIDQGVDDIMNVVSICKFFQKIVGIVVMQCMCQVMLIQIWYCVLEILLIEDQILVFQVLIFEFMWFLELCEIEMWCIYVLVDYGLMQVWFYEDIVWYGQIVILYVYLVEVVGCYVMDFLFILKFDNFKLDDCLVIQLFGVGCEQWIYVLLFYICVCSLDFDDYFFVVLKVDYVCVICGLIVSYLDEVIIDDVGGWMFVCLDMDYCVEFVEGGV